MSKPRKLMQLLIEKSLFYRGLLFLWFFFSASVEGSLAVRFCRRIIRLFKRWSRGSRMVELLWHREYRSLWEGSLFRALLRHFAGLFHRSMVAARGLWDDSRRSSLAAAFYSHGKRSLENSTVTTLVDLLLAFVAVSIILRLAVGLIQPLYLLAGVLSVALLLVVRLSPSPVEQAWQESLSYRFAGWLFSLSPEERGGSGRR